ELKMQNKPPLTLVKNDVIKPFEEKTSYNTQPAVPLQADVPPAPIIEESVEIPKISSNIDSTTAPKGSVSELFDEFSSNLDKKLSSELSIDLEHLRARITEDIGYASILNPMSLTIASLSSVPNLLFSMEIEDIRKKLNFWRKKINV
ncbi:MAG: hypothetical protein ACTSQL_09760, partial [Promethearchaeota archaeon]